MLRIFLGRSRNEGRTVLGSWFLLFLTNYEYERSLCKKSLCKFLYLSPFRPNICATVLNLDKIRPGFYNCYYAHKMRGFGS